MSPVDVIVTFHVLTVLNSDPIASQSIAILLTIIDPTPTNPPVRNRRAVRLGTCGRNADERQGNELVATTKNYENRNKIYKTVAKP
jgi:predicted pyridoxine 5'-phosphate oxidase superfamily flavin-nucleotide-binding protein